MDYFDRAERQLLEAFATTDGSPGQSRPVPAVADTLLGIGAGRF